AVHGSLFPRKTRVAVGMRTLVVSCWALAALLCFPRSASADAVTEWNERALACTVQAKQAPFASTRTMAMVQAAVVGAVNPVEHGYAPYKFGVSAPTGSSAEAAAVAAAHAVLLKLFPDQSTALDAAYSASLARIPEGAGKAAGVAVGEKVAGSFLAWRDGDGASAPNPYRPVTSPGVYVPTTLPAASQWAGVTPWL